MISSGRKKRAAEKHREWGRIGRRERIEASDVDRERIKASDVELDTHTRICNVLTELHILALLINSTEAGNLLRENGALHAMLDARARARARAVSVRHC